MSQMAPEPAPQTAPRAQSTNPFLRKLGPMPVWAWMAVGLGVALAFSLWQKNKAAASASKTSSGSGSTGAASTTASGTPSDLIPQFVNQVYNQTSPPNVTVNNATTNNVPASTPTPVTTPPPKQAQPGYPAPSDFEGWKTSGTSVQLHWNAVSPTPGAGYTWVLHDSSGNQKQGTTTGTNVNVSGLKKGTGYSIGVWANEGSGRSMGDQTWGYVQT